MAEPPEPVRDLGSSDPDESDELIAQYLELGGTVDGLSGPHDFVAATSALALRPPGPRLDLDQAADRLSIDPDLARQLWVGLGMDPAGRDLSEDDAVNLGLLGAAADLVGDAGAIELSRVVGLAARRIAEGLASLFRLGIEVPHHQSAGTRLDLARTYHDLIRERVPAVSSLVDTTLRHHLVDIATRAWAPDATQSVATRVASVGFADLVGFTEWAGSVSLPELASALDDFDALVWEATDATGAEVIKFIGDEVMFAAPTSEQALEMALRLVSAGQALDSITSIRAGIASGEVISRAGDLFGMTVIAAARLVAAADPGTVLVTEDAAADGDVGTEVSVAAKGFAEPIRARCLEP